MMLSFWETNYFIKYDFIIIGSGIVGLSTAYYLRKKFPQKTILIVERGLLPTGASTKNAGFACMGSVTELLDDLKHAKEADVIKLFSLRKNGLDRLKQILSPEQMGYETNGSYELISHDALPAIDKIDYLNELLFDVLGSNAFSMANEKLNNIGFSKKHVAALIENNFEGEINTGQMMKNLLNLVSTMGVEMKTGCEVEEIEDNGNEVSLYCKNALLHTQLKLQASKVFVCNNAFAKQLLPNLDVRPGRGQVLISKPIDNLPFKGIFHLQEGYYYFRAFNNRVLFGGGRNLDFEKETTTNFELNDMIQDDLICKLKEIILPNHAFEIEQQWAGIMAFGSSGKDFILQKHSNNILVGVRMNGMGIAIGSEVGFRLSEMANQ